MCFWTGMLSRFQFTVTKASEKRPVIADTNSPSYIWWWLKRKGVESSLNITQLHALVKPPNKTAWAVFTQSNSSRAIRWYVLNKLASHSNVDNHNSFIRSPRSDTSTIANGHWVYDSRSGFLWIDSVVTSKSSSNCRNISVFVWKVIVKLEYRLSIYIVFRWYEKYEELSYSWGIVGYTFRL